ncbi:MAG TPA: glycerophosphodiester phosphodiesterase family protein, partial [Virgibacillus sp.]|nr:glycerophosphodiester phosphodiesterase family protein [Virgibacillus sp.]
MRDKQKKRFNFRWIGWAFGIIGFMWMIIYFFPTTNSTKHAYFDHDRPLIIAHQGGEHLAPSGTLEAFKNAAQLGVDVIEFDIHMTKDGHLVSIHDPTVDR